MPRLLIREVWGKHTRQRAIIGSDIEELITIAHHIAANTCGTLQVFEIQTDKLQTIKSWHSYRAITLPQNQTTNS